jgi:hypothetical protein
MTDTIAAVIALVIGAALCFYGYPIFRLVLPLAGLIYGYIIGTSLVPPEQQNIAILIGILAAIVGVLLAYPLWSIGALIYGAVLGFGLGWWLGIAFGVDQTLQLIIAVVLALILGVLFFRARKLMVMLATAFNGAAAILYGLGILVPTLALSAANLNSIALIIWLVLGLIGFFSQYRLFGTRVINW